MFVATTPENRIGAAATVKRNKELTRSSKRVRAAMWIVQGLLAADFLFAGPTKLTFPIEVLTSIGSPNQIALPGCFLRFAEVAESRAIRSDFATAPAHSAWSDVDLLPVW
jgi:hypothetical protein